MLAPHQEQVGRRQHRDGDAGIGQPGGDLVQAATIDGGQLGDMADRDPAAPAVGVGLPAHLVEVHPGRVEVEIQMKVDVEIEAARDGEDARNLRRRIGVGVGAAADDVGALLAGLDQQFLGAGIVGQALLREHADLEVERPGVIALEGAYGVEAVEADARVDLDMGAHARRALDDGFLQGALRARVDVGLGEGALGRGHRFDRFLERPALAIAAVENAGLVEMDVGLDEARRSPAGRRAVPPRVGVDAGGDVDDAAVARRRCRPAPDRFRSAGPDAGEIERHGVRPLLRRLGAAEIGRLQRGVVGQSRRVVRAHDLPQIPAHSRGRRR